MKPIQVIDSFRENVPDGDEVTTIESREYDFTSELVDRIMSDLEQSPIVQEETEKPPSEIHHVVLTEVLNFLTVVDIREKANLGPTEKIKAKHEIVVVVDEVLRVANVLNYALCRNAGFVHIFNAQSWDPLDVDVLQRFLGEAAQRVGIRRIAAAHHQYWESLCKQFMAMAHLSPPVMPIGVSLVNCGNGTLEITPKGRRLREFRSSDFLTYKLPFNFDEGATCPKWDAFLDKALPDKSCQIVLAEFFGYIFTTLKLEKVLMLFGTGANGKSVIFEVMTAVLGKHNLSHYSLHALGSEYNRAMLSHKLLNYSSEVSTKMATDIFKKLASGEPCDARLPYGKPFTIENYCRFAFNCNELPKDVEHTPAFFRRFFIIPFNVAIPEEEQNPNLPNEIIETELSGVFNWILQGLERLLNQGGFSPCDAAQQVLERYRKESDSVAMFFEEFDFQTVVDYQDGTALIDIYRDYRDFCHDNGYYPLNSQNLRKRLTGLGFASKKQNKGIRVLAARR